MISVVTIGDMHVAVRTARQCPSVHVDAVSILVLWLISVPESGVKGGQTLRVLMKDKTSEKNASRSHLF